MFHGASAATMIGFQAVDVLMNTIEHLSSEMIYKMLLVVLIYSVYWPKRAGML